MNAWDTYSPFSFNVFAYSQVAPTCVLPIKQCFPQRFAEYAVARNSVEQMAFEEENWDGYGAFPVTFQTKTNAKVALIQLEPGAPAPQVTPNPNGTFSFEWETNHGTAHLEIGRTRYSFYVKPIVGQPYFARGHVNQIDATLGMRVDEGLFPKASATLSYTTTNV